VKRGTRSVKLQEVAALNPGLDVIPKNDDLVAFLPMSAVNADQIYAVDRETRRFAEVKGAYTPFLSNDVLVAKITPCFENGKIAHARLTRAVGFGSTEFHVIRPMPSRLDPRYLVHFLRQPRIRIEGERRMTGSAGQRRIPQQFIAQLSIPLPSVNDQRRIANTLDQVDAIRTMRVAAIDLLDTLTQSIFVDIFGDPSTGQQRWEVRRFGEVCETRLGKMLDTKQQTGKHRRPYLRNANVRWFGFDLAELYEMDFDDHAREVFRLRPGDLLICEGGEPGRAAVWTGELTECYYQKALHRARPDRKLLSPLYLAHLLWFLSHSSGMKDHVTSATIAHLTGEKLKTLPVPLPPIDLQNLFEARVEAIAALRGEQQRCLAHIDDLVLSIQNSVFSPD
jgi:type I restriction enzyme, S subunit